uniref:HECT-type E3 ubiquitin transferase n=2 Tax=Kalanchoe fedtschenkoi TaxID=63787 RepID=A0A7N0U1T4_KALFE
MKLKRKRALEVPPKIRCFIDNVIAAPFENIEEPLSSFVWEYDKGDFNHWVDLFNHFDLYFEKYVKPRKDLQLEDDFLYCDPPFPRNTILQILRVIRIILENCTNKNVCSSYEQHFASLLASTDADVVEACLQTLATFMKKTTGKCSIRDASLNSHLFSFAQGWGAKEEGLGLVACALPQMSDPFAYELGCTLHFEFYVAGDSSKENIDKKECSQGLHVIHVPFVSGCQETDLELLNSLVKEHSVPSSLRFSLLTRVRFARAFGSLPSRQQYTRIRLYAFVVLAQASSDVDLLVSFFNNEPAFIDDLVTFLSSEDAVPEDIRILCVLSLVALCQDRSRQPSVLTSVTSGGHRGILSSLMQKAVNSVVNNTSEWSVVFAEALLSLVTVLVSSSSGCSAMRESGFIPTLLPLLKDIDPQHLHLVCTAVHVLEAFMDYFNPAAALFRDLGGLDDTISRLNVEVSYIEPTSNLQKDNLNHPGESSEVAASVSHKESRAQPLYSEALVNYYRRLLMKALLRAISLGTYAPGSNSRVYGCEESLLPQCLCIIFRRAKEFDGGVFSLAAAVMIDLIHNDPTCYPVLETTGLPSAFMDAIMDGVFCSAEAITSIPQCLDALCLNNNGLQAVKDRNALRCFVKIFTSKAYLRVLAGDIAGSLSNGLDELMRHVSTLRAPGVDMLIEILNALAKMGSIPESFSVPTDAISDMAPVPMETDADEMNVVLSDVKETLINGISDNTAGPSSDSSSNNVESSLPDFINNAVRLLETILHNSEMCRIFVEKKGIEAVMQLFTLPLVPPSASLGQSISVAFKNFAPQHSVSLARVTCTFFKDQLKSTNEILLSIRGTPLAEIEASKQAIVMRNLSSLEGILCLLNFLLKGTANVAVAPELSSADSEIMKDLGMAYREVLWQISICCDSKMDEKKQVDSESENADAALPATLGRESDEDVNQVARYMNPVAVRSNSHGWGVDREFLSVVRSEGLHRRTRHGLSRVRAGRAGRHLDTLNIDSEVSVNVPETSSHDSKKKNPDVLILECLSKLASSMRSFLTALVKGFMVPNRRRAETGALSSSSKSIGTAIAQIFYEGLNFQGLSSPPGCDISPSVKCRYLGKVVDDLTWLIFDSRRRSCYAAMVNYFYVHGTFKELLTTFEATSQLLWTLFPVPAIGVDNVMSSEEGMFSHSKWLLDTLQNYCNALQNFVNSSIILSPTSTSQDQLLVQPAADSLSIGLFPVPREPATFVKMLQLQVLDVILPVWNHPRFPNCCPGLITSVTSLINHVYSGVGQAKPNHSGIGSMSQRLAAPPPDEATINTIVEMGFTRARAEEALRRVGANSVEMAMEWLFAHADDPVQEDDELARALALSLGNASETTKADSSEKQAEFLTEDGVAKIPPVNDILSISTKLFLSNDALVFTLKDLFVTICNRNEGEDRSRVISYLIQQLRVSPPVCSKDTDPICIISHILALIVYEDGNTRKFVAENGFTSIAIDILTSFKLRNESTNEVLAPKCASALLIILDSLLQSPTNIPSETTEGSQAIQVSNSSVDLPPHTPTILPSDMETESCNAFEKILGKSTGYVTDAECCKVLNIACDLIKQHVPAVVMQALLQLCARLTKNHSLALKFLEGGGMAALFSLPTSCFFPGYDNVASVIIRHLLEDPQTLQTAMESEIRQSLNGVRNTGRVTPRAFLTSMAPVISRDPAVFMKAVAATCQLESTGGRTLVVLSKEKGKDKDKSKALSVEHGPPSNEGIHIAENKIPDGPAKCSKSHKRVPINLAQVIDQLLDTVSRYPPADIHEIRYTPASAMEVDEPVSKAKGKSKVDDTRKLEPKTESNESAVLAKVTFVLKLLGDILQMYGLAAGVILKRDSELCQMRGLDNLTQGGIIHHILHRLLPLSSDKSAGSNEWKDKLSEKATGFLVVLCGRSSEGRRRVLSEIVKGLSSLGNVESNSSNNILLPNCKVLTFVELVHSILSKNASSSDISGSGFSPEILKAMIDSGIIKCLSHIIQVIDLDHPDAPRTTSLILKTLESLTRAVNASEQILKSDGVNKKKTQGSNGGANELTTVSSSAGPNGNDQGQSSQPSHQLAETAEQPPLNAPLIEENNDANPADSSEPDILRMEVEEMHVANPPPIGMDYMPEDMEQSAELHNSRQINMAFHVGSRAGVEIGEEDDDMGDDGEDEDDVDDEDEDIAEDGAGMMSLADTDIEDHDDSGLGDEYNDDMVDDNDDFHENRVIEVRWREALDGLDHLHVLGRPGNNGGLIDVTAEPFEGVNVDDLFGLRRPVNYERRRQGRSSFDRSASDFNGFNHPLLRRPSSHPGDSPMLHSGGQPPRDVESISAGNLDIAHFYMFDAPVLPYDHLPSSLFSDRFSGSGAPPLADYSAGMDPLHLSGRRGQGDSRWTDDGLPQAGGQSAVIAQLLEQEFIAQMQSAAPSVNLTCLQETLFSQPPLVQITLDQTNPVDSGGLVGVAGDSVEAVPSPATNTSNHEGHQITNTNSGFIADSSEAQCPDVDRSSPSIQDEQLDSDATPVFESNNHNNDNTSLGISCADVVMGGTETEENNAAQPVVSSEHAVNGPSGQNTRRSQENNQANDEDSRVSTIDPTFLEALPEDLREEVLASQQAQTVEAPAYVPPSIEDIDPEFLAALPPDIQAEVLAQQRAQRIAQQAEGQAVEMDNASIIATFPAELREEVLLTSSEAVLQALPSSLLAEAQMLRDRAMSHYQARSLFGNAHRLSNRRNGLGFDRQTFMDRGVGANNIGRRGTSSLAASLNVKEIEGEPFLDANALRGLVRLLRVAQPLGKGLLQRLMLNLCTHTVTRATLVHLLLDMIKPEAEGSPSVLAAMNPLRLYGCQPNVVYGRSPLLNGLPPLVLRRILENLSYLATNHPTVANLLFYFDSPLVLEYECSKHTDTKKVKGKNKIMEEASSSPLKPEKGDIPLILFLKLLNRPLFLRSIIHLEQLMGLIQVVVSSASTKLESQSEAGQCQTTATESNGAQGDSAPEVSDPNTKNGQTEEISLKDKVSTVDIRNIFLQLPHTDMRNLCSLLSHERLSDKVYMLASEVLKKLASVSMHHRKFFTSELSVLAQGLSDSAIRELVTFKESHMSGFGASSMTGAAILRVLQALNSIISPNMNGLDGTEGEAEQELSIIWKLNVALDPLWQELSNCIGLAETQLGQTASHAIANINLGEAVQGASTAPSTPLPHGSQRLLPLIEAFFVLCEKLQANVTGIQQDHADVSEVEVKESPTRSSGSLSKSHGPSLKKVDGTYVFAKFAEKHRRLLNAHIRQNPGLLEKSLSMLLKAPRLIDFDNKRSYFRSRIRQQHEHHLSGPLRISVRRAYILEDSYNQLRMRSTQDLKGRLNVQFQGEEGIDAGGLTREWYQLLSRVLFDKGALLFTTVGNNATFQPNPNSVYQTEHLSYFKFVGRVVAKALFDGQLLDVYFTRSFYKHILGVKVTYHDIEAVDPDYYKNLKWMLENDVSDIPDLTFSMDADEEKHILYEKTEVTDYELKPGGRNIRVTEETKHEYVDLVAGHLLTNAIRPQINAFLEGFNELVPRELISIFNDKELELLISGLPEIDLNDLKANTEYNGYTVASSAIQWFWEVVEAFSKEDMARLLQFVTGTSKVPLEGFKALQGISGSQRFQIHKAYGAPERLPSAHTCFNQLDLPEYSTKELLQQRLLLAIHEASEGFGFG